MEISAFFRTNAANIEQSLLTSKKSSDGLRTLATSVEQKAELLGKRTEQLSSLNLSNTLIFKALFEEFQHYQGLASEFKSVLPSVTKVQNDIENYKSQYELPKSSRKNKTPGVELAKLSTITASHATLTLESCLKKKAEIDSAPSSPLSDKSLEMLSPLDQHEDVKINGIARPLSPEKFSELTRARLAVTKQINYLDHEYKSLLAQTPPNASRLDLSATPTDSHLNSSENLVASSSLEQALTVVSIKTSQDKIIDIKDKLSVLFKKGQARDALIDAEIGKLDVDGVDFHSRNDALLTLRNYVNNFIENAAQELRSTTQYQKPLVDYLLASQQLPKEQRNPNAPDSKRSLSLASECVAKALESLARVEKGLSDVIQRTNSLSAGQ